MQTSQAGTIGSVGTLPDFADGKAAKRHGSEKTHYGSCGSRNAFLKSALKPIAPQQMTAGFGYERNCITQADYEYLRDSFFNYARLLQTKVKHNPGESYGEGIANLYDEMRSLIGEDIDVNIEPKRNGGLRFALWKSNGWGEYNLYWIPVKFIGKLRPKFRRVVITFLHELMTSNNLSAISDLDEADWIFEWIVDEKDEAIQSLIDSYQNGTIYKLLQRVKNRRYYKNLPQAIAKYEPADKNEEKFLQYLNEGLQFIVEDTPSIMEYEYDPNFEEEPDYSPIRLALQIGLIYDSTDLFTENMIEFLNNSMQQTYEVAPCTVLYLEPDTRSLFELDDYPKRFFAWMDHFISFICDTYE